MPATIQLPILGSGVSGRSRAVIAQDRQNIYLEVQSEQDKSGLVAYGTPGLLPFIDLGLDPVRGIYWYQQGNVMIVVAGNQVYEVTNGGISTNVGSLLTSTGTVVMADNGLQVMIVDGSNGYIYEKTTPDLSYSRASTTVTVTETLHTRVTGQSVIIDGDANVASGTYTITVPNTAATALVVGTEYVIASLGTSDFTLVGATVNAVGIVFTATGTTAGTGTCNNANTWTFTTVASGSATGDIRVLRNLRNITSAYTGVDFPGANTVVFLDSYFIINVPDTKQFWISAQYDGFYWNPLDYASKEAYTDDLSAVVVDNGNLVLVGYSSQEYWQNTGAFPFPFQRIAGSPVDVGVAARFSISKPAGRLTYLARTRRGGLSVVMIENYQPIPVSTPDLDYLFTSYQSPGDAIAFSYRLNGHDFYELNFQAEKVTWLYDATTKVWSKLASFNDTRHYANRAIQFDYKIFVTDYRKGKIYTLDSNTYTDDGDPIIRQLITPHFFKGDSFNKLHIYRLRLDMEQGVGLNNGQGENPQIMLQVSRDGGFTWGNEMWTTFGAQGQFLKRAEWRRLGVSRNFVFKFRISDPVKVVLIGAAAYATEAAK